MTEPTDAELDAVLCNHWPAFSMQATLVRMWVRAAMRDALAQWGTPPAVAGEPIGYLYCGGSYGGELADWEIVADQHQCDKLNEHHGALGKEAKLPLYTTPQPTQAQAGAMPLTDEQRKDLLAASFCIAAVGDPTATIKPDDAERIITLLHSLGGITKGGQHA